METEELLQTIRVRAIAEGQQAIATMQQTLKTLGTDTGALAKSMNVGAAAAKAHAAAQNEAAVAIKSTHQFVPDLTDRIKTMTAAGHGASFGFRMIKSSMAEMALESLGAKGPLSKLAEGMVVFSAGSGPMIAIAAGITLVALLFEKMQGAAEQAQEQIDKAREALHKWAEQRGHGVGPIAAELFKPSQEDVKKFGDDAKSPMELRADAQRRFDAALNQVQNLSSTQKRFPGLNVQASAEQLKVQEEAASELQTAWSELYAISARINQLMEDRGEKLREHTDEIKKQNEEWKQGFLAWKIFTDKLPYEVDKTLMALPTGVSDILSGRGMVRPNITTPTFGGAAGMDPVQRAIALRLAESMDKLREAVSKFAETQFQGQAGGKGFKPPQFGEHAASDVEKQTQETQTDNESKLHIISQRMALRTAEVTARAFEGMAYAATSGMDAIKRSMVSGLTEILQSVARQKAEMGLAKYAMGMSTGAGPWGWVSAGIGVTGALLGALLNRSSHPQPVHLVGADKAAADAMAAAYALAMQANKPEAVTIQVVTSAGDSLGNLQVDLANATKRDRIIRLPRDVPIGS